MVNNAGTGPKDKRVHEIEEEVWDVTMWVFLASITDLRPRRACHAQGHAYTG